jgi:MerR family transcriptional regulator, light-induced transcriptional regulator
MNDTNSFLARILNKGTSALASYAAADLRSSYPELEFGFVSYPFFGWKSWLEARLQEMAAAVAVGKPKIFAAQVQWANGLLISRGRTKEHSRASLVCLREVLESELPELVRALAAEYLDRGLYALDQDSAESSVRLEPSTIESRLATQYLVAVLEGDRRRAIELILQAVVENNSVADLYTRVLMPAQVEVGRMWHIGEINVAEEHFASATTKMVMAQLMGCAQFSPSNGKTMLAAAVAGNQIDIGPQVVADFFELDGWRTVQLGSDVPTADIVKSVDFFEVDILGLSASQSTQLETIRETVNAVRLSRPAGSIKILVGGFAFIGNERLPLQLGADGYAPDPASAVELGRQLVFGSARRAC